MLAEFRHALRLFLAASSAAVRVAGLTPQQHQTLLAIKSRGGRGMSVGELAEQMLLRPHSAGELVERLCRTGLAGRAPDPKDGRRVIVRLTGKADTILDRLTVTHVAELNRVRPALARLLEQLPPAP
jgi:DNA-binding MarR family transcriptional regulator